MTNLRSLSAVGLATGAVLTGALTVASPASAEVTHHRDAAHDVRWQPLLEGGNPSRPARHRSVGDVVRTTVNHHGGVVSVSMKYRQLARTGDATAHTFIFRTDRGLRRSVEVFAGPHIWKGIVTFEAPGSRTPRCKVSHRIDYVRNRVSVTVPRSCLHKPRWVRVGAGNYMVVAKRLYADDANINFGLKHEARLGPRVHHN